MSASQPNALTEPLTGVMVPAVASLSVSIGESMPRRRYQRGRLFSQGKRRKQWVAVFREDRIDQQTGTIRRVRRSVRLGLVKHVPKQQALTEMQKYLDAVNLVPAPPPKSGRTLNTFAQEWEQHVGSTLKPSTLRAVRSHLRTHLLKNMGEMSLTSFTARNVQALVTSLATAELSRKSIENVLTSLHSLLSTAKKWGYVPAVFERSAISLPRAGEKKESRSLEAEDVRRIIAASEEPYSTLYAVLACTGIRAGEALALKVTDIDFAHRLIKIRRTLDHATRLTQAPKSKASSADLPIPVLFAERLKLFLAHSWRENADGWLFCNSKGKPMQRDKVVYKLQKTLRDLGIEKAGLHAFRHMVASELLDAGASPSVAQRQMRHSDSRTTIETYSHIIGDAHRRAVDTLVDSVLRI
jgi:integrase